MNGRLAERSSDAGLLQRALPPLVLFAIALALRVLPWPTVLESNRVVFFGMDAWYHMRRILFALANSGWPPEFDAYVNFPHGAKPIWSPVFDALSAWLLWPVYAVGGLAAVERAAALLPPLLGSLCVVALYVLARRFFGRAVAWMAGLLLCFLSGHFWYSQIGFVDHHVAVALISTVLLSASMRLLSPTNPTRGLSAESGRRFGVTGAVAAMLLLLWPGSLIHVGIVALALLVFLGSRPERSEASAAAVGCMLLYGVAFGVVAPLAFASDWSQWSEYSPAVLSRFQPWMFGALALHAAACAALWRTARFGRSRAARAVQVGGIGVATLGLSLWAFPDLVAGAADAWRWLARDEEFQELVKESRPLFYGREGFDLANAELRLSRFVWLLPVSLAALAWRARASRLRPPLLLLLLWVCVLTAGTLLQRRFFNSLSPAFALVIAWTCVEAARWLPPALVATPLRRGLCGAVAAVGALWMLAPSLDAYRLPLSNGIRLARGEPRLLRPVEQTRRSLLDAAEWLRVNTPSTSGYLDPDAAPEYGVLAPWGYGHLLKYAARRPTVVGNFGDDVGEANLRKVDVYFLNREQEATWSLDRLQARYVLLRTLDEADPEKLRGEAMRKRLSVDDSPGLAHHRLVYESPLDPTRSASGRSEFRIFEYVPGAEVSGAAPAGAQVRATLRYQSNRGRRGSYRTSSRADASGHYRLRLPYSTRAVPPGIVPDGAYRISSGTSSVPLEIAETQVQDGLAVEGPSFANE